MVVVGLCEVRRGFFCFFWRVCLFVVEVVVVVVVVVMREGEEVSSVCVLFGFCEGREWGCGDWLVAAACCYIPYLLLVCVDGHHKINIVVMQAYQPTRNICLYVARVLQGGR